MPKQYRIPRRVPCFFPLNVCQPLGQEGPDQSGKVLTKGRQLVMIFTATCNPPPISNPAKMTYKGEGLERRSHAYLDGEGLHRGAVLPIV